MKKNSLLVIIGTVSISILFIFFSMWSDATLPQDEEVATPQPSSTPYSSYIAAVGVVEPSSGNVFIGAPVNRIVEKILVTVGQKVRKGDLLIQLDDRDLQADLKVKQIEYEKATAQFQKLKEFPRPQDLASAEATVKTAQIELAQAKSQYEMVQGLRDIRAMSRQERERRQFLYQQAQTNLLKAQNQLEKIKQGTWKPDLDIAQLEMEQVKADVERIKAEIERTQVHSPIKGTVLQIKIHEGEFPSSESLRTPLMIIGNTDEMHLRVSINQFEIPRFRQNAPAIAYLQGDRTEEYALQFVRVEPLLIPKQNVTNDITDRVDTRVLQVIYNIKPKEKPLFTGQQMDVLIKADDSKK